MQDKSRSCECSAEESKFLSLLFDFTKSFFVTFKECQVEIQVLYKGFSFDIFL